MGNALYHKYEDAKSAMAQEINDARENFTDLETLSDMACYYEARDEDGSGFSVTLEEKVPL